MQLRADFIVGKQTPNSWAGVYGFKPEDSIEPLELFAIIKLATAVEEPSLEPLAKMFLDELQNYLFSEGKEGDYVIRLENAVWKMKSKMEVLLSSDERYSQSGLDVEIALALFDRNFLYLGIVGESKIYIKREDRFVELSQGLTDGNMMGFLKTGSMELEPGDRLVLATSSAAELAQGSIESAVTNLNIDNLSSVSTSEGIGILLLADENDLWSVKDISDQVEVDAVIEENQGIKESPDYIPVQAEDFDDELETPSEISEDGLELEVEEDHHFVNTDEILENVSVPMESSTEEDGGQNNRPQGQVMLSNLKNKLSSGFSAGKSSVGNLRSRLQKNDTIVEGTDPTNEIDGQPEVKNRVLSFITSFATKLKEFSRTKLIPFFKKSNKTYIKYLRDFVLVIFRFIKKVAIWFKKEFIGGGVDDRRDIFAKARRRKRNRIILFIFVIILSIFIISTINNRNAELAEQARIEGIKNTVDDYQSQLDSLVSQSNVNLDDVKKNALLDQLSELESKLTTQRNKGLFVEQIDSQLATITRTEDKITGSVGFTQPQVIADLGKIYSEANLSDLVYTQGNLYASDKQRNTIYQIGTNLNSEATQFVSDLNSPYTMTVNVDGDIIFYDNDSSGSLGKVSVSDGQLTRYPSLSPAVIGSIAKAAIFSGNDALYELHQNHQQIFKREREGDTYSSGGAVYNTQNPPNWKTDPELGSAIDIDVPYEIYVLVRGKGLRRYLAGENNTITKETFINTTDNDYNALSAATAIDTDGKLLAVADPTNRRVMLFSIQDNDAKNLVYEKSFVYRGDDSSVFKNIKEVVVNEASNNIFVLDGTSIVRIDL